MQPKYLSNPYQIHAESPARKGAGRNPERLRQWQHGTAGEWTWAGCRCCRPERLAREPLLCVLILRHRWPGRKNTLMSGDDREYGMSEPVCPDPPVSVAWSKNTLIRRWDDHDYGMSESVCSDPPMSVAWSKTHNKGLGCWNVWDQIFCWTRRLISDLVLMIKVCWVIGKMQWHFTWNDRK